MKRNHAGGFGFLGQLVFLLLVLCPALWRAVETNRTPLGGEQSLEAARMALEVAHLRESNRRLQEELRVMSSIEHDSRSAEKTAGRYRAFSLDLLSFGDPDPGRRALWVRMDPDYGVHDDATVMYQGTLVGRLVKLPWIERVARVQTLADPGFRVKFLCEGTRGILYGTGRREEDGERRPVLEARHLLPLGPLPAGAPVVTAGGDGIYPPGILIGQVLDAEEHSAAHPEVRAALSPEDASEVIALVDLARADWAQAMEGMR